MIFVLVLSVTVFLLYKVQLDNNNITINKVIGQILIRKKRDEVLLNVVSEKIGKILLLLKGNDFTCNYCKLLRTITDSLSLAYRELIEANEINKQGSEFMFKL